MFSYELWKISKNTLFTEHLRATASIVLVFWLSILSLKKCLWLLNWRIYLDFFGWLTINRMESSVNNNSPVYIFVEVQVKIVEGYVKILGFRPPRPPNVLKNLKLYLKIFSLKQKRITYFQLLQKKSNCVSLKKQPHFFSGYKFWFRVNTEITNHTIKQTKDHNGEL